MNTIEVTIETLPEYPYRKELREFAQGRLGSDYLVTVVVTDTATQTLARGWRVSPPVGGRIASDSSDQTRWANDHGMCQIIADFERSNPWPSSS